MAIRIRAANIHESPAARYGILNPNGPRLWNLRNRAYTALRAMTAGLMECVQRFFTLISKPSFRESGNPVPKDWIPGQARDDSLWKGTYKSPHEKMQDELDYLRNYSV
jgi:hypothetical protein